MLQPINLQIGCPSPSLFPSQDIISAASATLSDDKIAAEALIYGPDHGFQSLRESVARWLTDFYHPAAGPISPSSIIISNGASGNLANILAKFTDPIYTRRIWMVEPTYFLACPIFEDAGFVDRLRGIPEDDEGIDIDFLREGLTQTDAEAHANGSTQPLKTGPRYPKLYRHIIYCVPAFSNPTGKTMSLRRRESLIRIARAFDALVIADDVYDFLRWPSSAPSPSTSTSTSAPLPHPPPRLVDLDRSLPYPPSSSPSPSQAPSPTRYGNALSNSTFSKLLAPGLRVSFCDCPTPSSANLLSQVGSTQSGGAPSHMSSVFVDNILRSGALQRHVTLTVLPTYARRRAVMVAAVERWLVRPFGVRIVGGAAGEGEVAGGFFLYLLFPPHFPDAKEIADVALREQKLTVAPGEMMAVKGDGGSLERGRKEGGFVSGVRLSWSWCGEREIEEGVWRLGGVVGGLVGGGH
ncbi:MAG: hypothetical protein Q9160_004057 [Pyrenula sp. 1 TL-2023]